MSTPYAPNPQRGMKMLAWSTGFLLVAPVWAFVMFGLVSALGISGDSGSAAADVLLTVLTLVPAVASLILGGLAFRADHRLRGLLPPLVIVAFVTLLVVTSYLEGDAAAWVLLLPVAAAVPTVVAMLWPHASHASVAVPPTAEALTRDEPHHVG